MLTVLFALQQGRRPPRGIWTEPGLALGGRIHASVQLPRHACFGADGTDGRDDACRNRSPYERTETPCGPLDNVFAVARPQQDHGRNEDEVSVVLVENNVFAGFGWMSKEESISDPLRIKDFIKPYSDNRDVQQIIKGFLNTGKAMKIIRF